MIGLSSAGAVDSVLQVRPGWPCRPARAARVSRRAVAAPQPPPIALPPAPQNKPAPPTATAGCPAPSSFPSFQLNSLLLLPLHCRTSPPTPPTATTACRARAQTAPRRSSTPSTCTASTFGCACIVALGLLGCCCAMLGCGCTCGRHSSTPFHLHGQHLWVRLPLHRAAPCCGCLWLLHLLAVQCRPAGARVLPAGLPATLPSSGWPGGPSQTPPLASLVGHRRCWAVGRASTTPRSTPPPSTPPTRRGATPPRCPRRAGWWCALRPTTPASGCCTGEGRAVAQAFWVTPGSAIRRAGWWCAFEANNPSVLLHW